MHRIQRLEILPSTETVAPSTNSGRVPERFKGDAKQKGRRAP